jgi:hypothetical protein
MAAPPELEAHDAAEPQPKPRVKRCQFARCKCELTLGRPVRHRDPVDKRLLFFCSLDHMLAFQQGVSDAATGRATHQIFQKKKKHAHEHKRKHGTHKSNKHRVPEK